MIGLELAYDSNIEGIHITICIAITAGRILVVMTTIIVVVTQNGHRTTIHCFARIKT